MKQAVILAGGKGTRLRERLGDLPKPLIDIVGIPLLERQILLLKKYHFQEILILVNYASEKIIEFCNSKNNWGLKINCIDDGQPLGTAGATLKIFDLLEHEFLVMYGDTMLEVDLDKFHEYHLSNHETVATLFLHPNDHPQDSDIVEIDDSGNILHFHNYPHEQGKYFPNLVNAALYWIKKDGIAKWRNNQVQIDFAKDLFPLMLSNGLCLRGYNSIEYIKDTGTPRRLDKVCEDFISGKISKYSLHNKQKAVFIDRDGTLNKEVDQLNHPNQLELIPGSDIAIKNLNKSEYINCIITNQPVIARGECTVSVLKTIHNKMETLLGENGAYINRIYYCPHHPDSGFEGEIKHFKINCSCRKPSIGMIQSAVKDLNIDLNDSWFIGDTTTDILTAKRAGLKSILVETGYAGLDYKYWVLPDFIVPNLERAVNFILNGYPSLLNYCKTLINEKVVKDFIIVGGLSRSGKSTFSNILKYLLQEKGKKVHVISLDRWLKSEKDRTEGVVGRYDIEAFLSFIFKIQNSENGSSLFHLPGYHKLQKESKKLVETIEYSKGDIIIIEGTIALQIEYLTGLSKHKFFITINEKSRKERVINEYLMRGFTSELANEIYINRQIDEAPFILKSSDSAIIVDMTTFIN
jgi:histidinol-phosphate phosphatase family protein